MKASFILALLVVHAGATQPLVGRITAKSLSELQAKDPMIRLVKPAEGDAKVARPQNQSIVKQSTILSDGKSWTLVPKGALVHVPERLKPRVDNPPAGQLLPWLDFLAMNRAWVTTNEVTFQQAKGDEPIPAECTTAWAKQDKVVVAVHHGGPISVHKNHPPTLTQR